MPAVYSVCYDRIMSKNIILTILILIAVVVGAYLLLSYKAPGLSDEEQLLSDADYLLDDSIFNEVNDALNDVLLTGFLDKEALAAEEAQLDLLAGFEVPSEIDQYLNEVAQ